jgi:hypothetical protein
MGDRRFGELGGHGGEEETEAKGSAPGREDLTSQMGGSAQSMDAAWGGSPTKQTATRIDMTTMGGADPFNFTSFGGMGAAEDGDMGGAATKSSTSTTAGPNWLDHGSFRWVVAWGTDGTSGWIVQKVTNTLSGTKKDGTVISPATYGITPIYYEAWAVDSAGKVTPTDGTSHDWWTRGSRGAGSKGNWSMRGDVYWTDKDPAKSGLTPGGVSNAGILLSGTTAPAGLSAALQVRTANGVWDSSGATPTHTGTAK